MGAVVMTDVFNTRYGENGFRFYVHSSPYGRIFVEHRAGYSIFWCESGLDAARLGVEVSRQEGIRYGEIWRDDPVRRGRVSSLDYVDDDGCRWRAVAY